jgi:hypothetical protein
MPPTLQIRTYPAAGADLPLGRSAACAIRAGDETRRAKQCAPDERHISFPIEDSGADQAYHDTFLFAVQL